MKISSAALCSVLFLSGGGNCFVQPNGLNWKITKVTTESKDRHPWQTSELVLCAGRQETQERRKAESLQASHPLMSLNLNLDSLARGGAATRAQELLERIEALYKEGYYSVSPDIVSYNSVLKAWSNNNRPDKSLELLRKLDVKHEGDTAAAAGVDNSKNSIQANIISYNTIIYAFAKNGMYQEAEQILREMQHHPDEGLRPDTVSFNSLLYAYAQSKDKEAPAKAEALLREMMTDENEAQVDTSSFNVVLHCWANSKKEERAPHRAQELLDHMETLSMAGNNRVQPDVYSYTTVIQAWVSQLRNRQKRREAANRGKFDRKTQKLLQNKKLDAARAANKLLRRMEEQGLQPNQVTYTSVMTALCFSGKAEEAHALMMTLLERFEQQQAMVGESSSASSMLVKPDTVAFSALMSGWNNSGRPNAAERVLELLQLMKDWEVRGLETAPNGRTYTTVLSALAKSRTWDACLQAKDMLQEIPGGPSTIHYNAILDAFAKSPRADKAIHAKALLEEMIETEDCPPDLISFNSVISAAAGSFGNDQLKRESLAIATAMFKHICQSEDLDPSPYTFSVMIKAVRKLIIDVDTRYDYVRKIFQLCCKKGKLNAGVWQQVKKSIPQDESTQGIWQGLLGSVPYTPGLQVSDLPKAWRKY